MRLVLALAAILVLLAPAAALAQAAHPAECRRIAHQLAHFERMQERAETLDNDLWAGRFDRHIGDLEDRQSRVCPEDSAALQAAQQMRDLLRLAAQGALTFFTLGAF